MCVISLCTRGALDTFSRGRSTAALAVMEREQRGRRFTVASSVLFFVVVAPLVGAVMPIVFWLAFGVLGAAGGLISPLFDDLAQFFRFLSRAYIVVVPPAVLIGAIFGLMLTRGNDVEDRRRRRWVVALSSAVLSPLWIYVAAQSVQTEPPIVAFVLVCVLGPIVFGITGKIFTAAFISNGANRLKAHRNDA